MMNKLVFYIGFLLYTVYFVNEVHFIINSEEINANIVELIKKRRNRDIVVLSFIYKGEAVKTKKVIKRDVYNALINKSNVTILYDSFILKTLYLKKWKPKFLKLIIDSVIFIVFVFSVYQEVKKSKRLNS